MLCWGIGMRLRADHISKVQQLLHFRAKNVFDDNSTTNVGIVIK